jgi:hypothetical protein
VEPSFLSVAPSHTPVAGLHVPGLRQGPACAVQLTLLAVHKSAGCRKQSKKASAPAFTNRHLFCFPEDNPNLRC